MHNLGYGLGDGGTDHDAPVPGQGAGNSWAVQASLLNSLKSDGQQGVWLDGESLGGQDGLVSDEELLSGLLDEGVDLAGNLGSVDLSREGLGHGGSLGGDEGGGGQETSSGLGDQGSVGDLDFLGDLVGGDGDSEDGGEAGDGEDGSDDDGGLHGLDRPLNVGQLSLEAGHGASSLGFHNDCLLVVTSVFEFVFVKVSETRKCKSHIYLAEDKKNFAEDKEIFFLMF